MGTQGKDSPFHLFSADSYPERERVEAWNELYARKACGVDFSPRSGAPFSLHARASSLPGLQLMAVAHSPMQMARTRSHLADGHDGIVIALPDEKSFSCHLGSEFELEPGDAMVLLTTATIGFASPMRTECMTLYLEPAQLFPMLRDKSRPPFGRVPRHNEPLRLLRRYLRALWEEPLGTVELQQLVANQFYDLAALALGANGDAAEHARRGGLAAARLDEAKAYARAHLRRPDLSLDEIALRQKVTPHYLRTLFEKEGTTFTQFVRDRRLELAHRMLSSSRFDQLPISTIAFDAGFGDLSHFNRAFRARYGAKPSDVRAAAQVSLGGMNDNTPS